MRLVSWTIPCAFLFATALSNSAGAAEPIERLVQSSTASKLAALGARPVTSLRLALSSGDPLRGPAGAILDRLKHGQGVVCWPNSSRLLTNRAGMRGATWYHANGRVLTQDAFVKGATCYWENGQVMTRDVGVRGATWYYENGAVMCRDVGVGGATWYDNRGNVTTYNGPAWSEQETMDRCYVRLIEDSLRR